MKAKRQIALKMANIYIRLNERKCAHSVILSGYIRLPGKQRTANNRHSQGKLMMAHCWIASVQNKEEVTFMFPHISLLRLFALKKINSDTLKSQRNCWVFLPQNAFHLRQRTYVTEEELVLKYIMRSLAAFFFYSLRGRQHCCGSG